MHDELWDLYDEYYSVSPLDTTNNIDIGVADSIRDPTPIAPLNNAVGRKITIRNSPPTDPDHHGRHIASILDRIPGSRLHFFQFTDENGNFRDRDLMKAIEKAKWHGEVDMLNISAGSPHIPGGRQGCTSSGADCALCEVAESAIEEGITIVAAAGNDPEESVHCPSLSNRVISVGGVALGCTAEVDSMNDAFRSTLPGQANSQGSFHPPNALWIDGTARLVSSHQKEAE